jgi:hypothetical protein
VSRTRGTTTSLTNSDKPTFVSATRRVITPDEKDRPQDIRFIDEENEDYPYPRDCFAPNDLPQNILNALEAA